jgi:hypothetical protein
MLEERRVCGAKVGGQGDALMPVGSDDATRTEFV